MNSTLIENLWQYQNQFIVKFRKSAALYVYTIPEGSDLLEVWLTNDSIGQFFLKNIKDKIPFVKFDVIGESVE